MHVIRTVGISLLPHKISSFLRIALYHRIVPTRPQRWRALFGPIAPLPRWDVCWLRAPATDSRELWFAANGVPLKWHVPTGAPLWARAVLLSTNRTYGHCVACASTRGGHCERASAPLAPLGR
jgi:hypothetical protein